MLEAYCAGRGPSAEGGLRVANVEARDCERDRRRLVRARERKRKRDREEEIDTFPWKGQRRRALISDLKHVSAILARWRTPPVRD
jgi:hypothetical protein